MRISDSKDLRIGFTLLELLVVLGIVGVLVSILLPAVQQARQHSRAIQCRSRLKQIGLANHSFHETNGEFPRSFVRMWELLPHIEQTSLHDEMSQFVPFGDVDGMSGGVPDSIKPNVSTYVCPATSAKPSRFELSYFANAGTFWTGLARDRHTGISKRNGMSSKNWFGGGVKLRDALDGTSNTAFFSEIRRPHAATNRFNGTTFNQSIAPLCWDVASFPKSTLEFGSLGQQPCKPTTPRYRGILSSFRSAVSAIYQHISPPNSASIRIPEFRLKTAQLPEAISPSSEHLGGVNVLKVDGSVNFVSNNIDLGVWQDLGSRDSSLEESSPLKL